MNQHLFRSEVYAARRAAPSVCVPIEPPTAGWIGIWLGMFIIIGFVLILSFGYYTSKVQVSGVIVSEIGADNTQEYPRLQAELRVPAGLTKFLFPGDRVIVHVRSGSDMKSGSQIGLINAISALSASSERASQSQRRDATSSRYLVLVDLEDQATIKPGMEITADLVLQKQMFNE